VISTFASAWLFGKGVNLLSDLELF